MSFTKLVEVTAPVIKKLPVNREDGEPRPCDLTRRKYSARDIVGMTMKYLTTKSEVKDLHVQFGAIHTCYIMYVELGMNAIVNALFGHKYSRVKWDRSKEGLGFASNLTKYFVGLGGHVIAMIDGLKLETLNPTNSLDHNRDYNGWHSTVNRNLVLVFGAFSHSAH